MSAEQGEPAAPPNAVESPAAGATASALPPPTADQRRSIAAWGGVLAGLGVGIALLGMTIAIVNAIEQKDPSLQAAFWVVTVVGGGLIATGLALMASALLPNEPAAKPAAPASPEDPAAS
jgi:hypothetical protein